MSLPEVMMFMRVMMFILGMIIMSQEVRSVPVLVREARRKSRNE
jgi:hypothetical protein